MLSIRLPALIHYHCNEDHLMSAKFGTIKLFNLMFSYFSGKAFQNRRVSSPAPVTIVFPSGLTAKYKTLQVCPSNVATFFISGYFQITI